VAVVCVVVTMSGVTAQAGAEGRDGSGRIIWSRATQGDVGGQIMSMRPDGTDLREVTGLETGGFDINAVSPDGRFVLVEHDGAESVSIQLVSLSNGEVRTIDLGCVDPCVVDLEPSWTPDGKRFMFTRVQGPIDDNGNAQFAALFEATLDGRHLRRISPAWIDGTFEEYHARWTPDGQTMVFRRIRTSDQRSALFATNARRTTTRQLTPWNLDASNGFEISQRGPTRGLVVFDTHNVALPSPDGASRNVATVPSSCKTLNDCTRKIRYITDNGSGPISSTAPSWSPDGTRIAMIEFGRDPWGQYGDVWIANADGSERIRLTNDAYGDFYTGWAPSPD
jgi:Tol biopolymer transport system component